MIVDIRDWKREKTEKQLEELLERIDAILEQPEGEAEGALDE